MVTKGGSCGCAWGGVVAAAHCGPVRVDRVEVRPSHVHAAQHERGRDVALVLKEAPLQERHGSDDARGPARLQRDRGA